MNDSTQRKLKMAAQKEKEKSKKVQQSNKSQAKSQIIKIPLEPEKPKCGEKRSRESDSVSPPKPTNKLMKIMDAMAKYKGSIYFHDPVNPEQLGITTYFDVIKRPMDFSTIRKKILVSDYSDELKFASDLHLVFDNAIEFNDPQSEVASYATKMKKHAEH